MNKFKNLDLIDTALERDLILYLLAYEVGRVEFMSKVSTTFFSEPIHRRVFKYIYEMFSSGKKISRKVLLSKIGEQNDWVLGLGSATRDDIFEIINVLRTLAEKRALYDIADKMQVDVIGGKNPNKIVGQIVQQMSGLLKEEKGADPYAIMKTLNSELESFHKGKRLTTGIRGLDNKLPAFVRGHIWIIGARTGGAKSWTALQFAKNIAEQEGYVAIFSTEMRDYENLGRIIGNEFGKGFHSFWQPESGIDFFNTKEVKAYLKKVNPYMKVFDEKRTVDEIAVECRKLLFKKELDVVIIDFFQNLDVRGRDMYEGFKKAAQELQSIAKDLGVTIIITSQLSNSFAQRADSGFGVVEYKNAGEIAASADVGLLLTHATDAEGFGGFPENLEPINCIIAKSRHTYIREPKVPLVLEYPSGQVKDVPDQYNWLIKTSDEEGLANLYND